MKTRRPLLILALLALGAVVPIFPARALPSIFQSPLQFTGSQWQVESLIGPIYLARQEGETWRQVSVFDGTNGKYHLNWAHPAKGVYVAMDSQGTCSTAVRIGEETARLSRSAGFKHVCTLPECFLQR
ncbi:MAG: hypothetical protein HZC55_23930 [Verrucomicrobia bacterium]|nr:hypothetical protein [Verrucomicrobiota bacterium]